MPVLHKNGALGPLSLHQWFVFGGNLVLCGQRAEALAKRLRGSATSARRGCVGVGANCGPNSNVLYGCQLMVPSCPVFPRDEVRGHAMRPAGWTYPSIRLHSVSISKGNSSGKCLARVTIPRSLSHRAGIPLSGPDERLTAVGAYQSIGTTRTERRLG